MDNRLYFRLRVANRRIGTPADGRRNRTSSKAAVVAAAVLTRLRFRGFRPPNGSPSSTRAKTKRRRPR